MSLFTIADLHLSHTSNKPMDVFGPAWENHVERLRDNWQSKVSPDDTVVIPGDISWGMRRDDARADLAFIESLNGRKIIGKGNHDYWWATMKKMYEFRDEIGALSIDFLFNNAFYAEGFIICGSRGWFPEDNYGPDDEKIVNREAERIRASLKKGFELQNEHPEAEVLLFLHYPPAYGDVRCDRICEVIKESGVKRVFYGHLHGAQKSRIVWQVSGADTVLVAADWLKFDPLKIEKRY
ncbi:MAG: metallophosphoesterase [Clostridia bacterium]|nr:metallophosphoesterase [Clostridia bacterium]